MNNVYTLRQQIANKARETNQRLGQAFFNYFLTTEQQQEASLLALYQINTKVELTVWLLEHIIDYDPITLRHVDPPD